MAILAIYLDSTGHRDWGLRPERLPGPVLCFYPAALDSAFGGLPWGDGVTPIRVPDDEGAALTDATLLAATAGTRAGGAPVFAARLDYLATHCSLAFLYDGSVHRWLDSLGAGPVCYRHQDGPFPPDIVGGGGMPATLTSTHHGDLTPVLLRRDPRPKALIIGDSHTQYLFTNGDLIGQRAVVVEPLTLGGRELLKVTRHLGAVTMHGLSSGAALNADAFREHGLGEGDTVVTVCGEIDIRAHVLRVAARTRQAPEAVVRHLCARFAATLHASVQAFGRLEVIVAGPAPPLEVERIEGNTIEVAGSIEERVRCTRLMRNELAMQCARRGWSFLDVYGAFADERGALDVARSDLFCHVSHHHKGPALAALHERLSAAAPVR